MKEMPSGLGSEGRLERSKGESRQDNVHLEVGNQHISNNNEGERACRSAWHTQHSWQRRR